MGMSNNAGRKSQINGLVVQKAIPLQLQTNYYNNL
jgi:hypothetical protein